MDKDREVLYNFRRSKQNLNCNNWWFLIKNQNREIEEIQRKIYTLFSPIVNEFPSLEGVVKNSALRYKLLNFESYINVPSYRIRQIYKKVARDSKLYDRKSKDGLRNFLAEQLEK